MKSEKIKIGVVGVGHLGQYHAKHYHFLDGTNLVGVYDTDSSRGEEIAKQYNTKFYNKPSDLMQICDAISVVTPTGSHYNVAKMAIEDFNCHVFIEKPITETIQQADDLIKLAKAKKKIIQVGHIERLNPALRVLEQYDLNPKFIEIQRLAPYTVRGTDVPVVLDLMIHDIDIILNIVKSKVKEVKASGVSIVSNSPDIANARIEFENKCVANLTASRISLKKMRKTRIFQKDAYISIDFLEKELQIVKIKDADKSDPNLSMVIKTNTGKDKIIYFENPEIIEENSILNELESFANSINKKSLPKVTLLDGYEAIKVANEVMSQIQ